MDFLTLIHWDAILKIIGIDILLGGDNAVVIAMACKAVPLDKRKIAILGGTAAAILLRGIVLVIAAFLIGIPYLKIAAGMMLFWIGFKLLDDSNEDPEVAASDKVWGAIKTIAIADLIMSIDNVFAVTGASQSAGEHSMFYAIAGILVSIPFIVFGATIITKLMDRFPVIIWAGAGLLGWVGAEMILSDGSIHGMLEYNTEMFIKVAGFVLVVVAGAMKNAYEKEEVQHV